MDFYRRVEIVCKSIPCGKVATYGQIALLCGAPRHARQVGYALNRILSGVPAHRVVNHQGYLSGAPAFQTPDLQAQLLMAEGIAVDGGCKVDLKKYRWKTTLSDIEILQDCFQK